MVLDPVHGRSTGADLLRADAIDGLRSLMSRADVVTPNLSEAATLLDAPLARNEDAMRAQARKISRSARAVLIKGGHGGGPDSVDLLIEADGCARFTAPRIATKNTHGTGCTLSSAIAAGLAKGLALNAAVHEAKAYVTAAIAAADRVKSATATARCIIFTSGGKSRSGLPSAAESRYVFATSGVGEELQC